MIKGFFTISENDKTILKIENQILKDGYLFAKTPVNGLNFVQFFDKILCGEQINPDPSTYTTYQALQSPLAGFAFNRVAMGRMSETAAGCMYSFTFKREKSSYAGYSITELAVQVSNGQTSKLFSRVVALPGQILHQLSGTHDTYVTYDLIEELI